MSKRKDRFVVGHPNANSPETVWGDSVLILDQYARNAKEGVRPMTPSQIKQNIRSKKRQAVVQIYRLQPMKLVDGRLVPEED